MSAWRRFAGLPLLAAVSLFFGFLTADPRNAAIAAAVAALLLVAFLGLVLQEHVRFSLPPPPELEGDPLILLGRSFREGEFGRRRILARLAGIETGLPFDPAKRLEEERAALAAPEREFLDYVESRIAEVEART